MSEATRPVEVTTDIRVVIDPPRWLGGDIWGLYSRDSIEDQSRRAEEWAREFEAFVRDHRSQDPVTLSVERVRAVVCSACEQPWETDVDGEPAVLRCAYCGAPVESAPEAETRA